MTNSDSKGSFFGELKAGDAVELLIDKKTDLGYNVLINQKYEGLLYANEIFEFIRPGDVKQGYIKLIREDGKIDVSLQKQGFKHIEDTRKIILDKLQSSPQGLLKLGDKSNPEDIYRELKISKKAFKKTLGTLYKERLIYIGDYETTLIDNVGE
jgi:predicted RNA-binding protein (virulence factor B family)